MKVVVFDCVATREKRHITHLSKHMNTEHEYLQPQDHFLTFDLSLASSLALLEYDLIAINKSNRVKAQFIFRRRAGIDLDIKQYWDGDLKLSARHLFDTQKMLKNRLYSD